MNKAFRKEVSEYESQNSNVKSAVGGAQTEADKARNEQQRLHQENQVCIKQRGKDEHKQGCMSIEGQDRRLVPFKIGSFSM
jgi:hypothetical protein